RPDRGDRRRGDRRGPGRRQGSVDGPHSRLRGQRRPYRRRVGAGRREHRLFHRRIRLGEHRSLVRRRVGPGHRCVHGAAFRRRLLDAAGVQADDRERDRTTGTVPGGGLSMRIANPALGRPDRGSTVIWLLLLTPTLFGFAGLVLDGGRVLTARQKAANIAEQAARVGVDTLDTSAYRG